MLLTRLFLLCAQQQRAITPTPGPPLKKRQGSDIRCVTLILFSFADPPQNIRRRCCGRAFGPRTTDHTHHILVVSFSNSFDNGTPSQFHALVCGGLPVGSSSCRVKGRPFWVEATPPGSVSGRVDSRSGEARDGGDSPGRMDGVSPAASVLRWVELPRAIWPTPCETPMCFVSGVIP